MLNGLAWAGRAVVEHRREQAFLLYTIALEALLTNAKRRAGITNRLQIRLAHLIAREPEQRKRIAERVSELYATRSAIVHAGDWRELTDLDTAHLRELVEYALTAMLLHPPYVAMKTVTEFERWLDDRVYGEPQIPTP